MGGTPATSSRSAAGHASSWAPVPYAKPVFTNPSRKRCRDEDMDADTSNPQGLGSVSTKVAPAPPVEEKPVYGEGMVLLNPRTGMAVSAESQTGTWYEEKAEDHVVSAPPISSRSPLLQDGDNSMHPGRKSQRLDNSAPGLDDVALASISRRLHHPACDDGHSRSLENYGSSGAMEEPHVDDVTCLLGISWQRVSHDDDMAPAVCGWEKYIDNHFARYLHGARILFKNRSLNAFLVAASGASQHIPATSPFEQPPVAAWASLNVDPSAFFFLFKEDLTEAQLVGTTWDRCLQNLRSVPIHFEGSEILRASERSPERLFEDEGIPVNCVVGNGIPIARISKENHAVVDTNGVLGDDMVTGSGMAMELDS
jgi:hypothetical protein